MAGYNQVPSRNLIKIGAKVQVAEKANYENGQITKGIVQAILTSKPDHPRGIKVRLTSGAIGRVQALEDDPVVSLNNAEPTPTETELSSDFKYEPRDDELT